MADVYRFALIGQTKSGKTCYLTTLAMGAIGHPGGMTATWCRDMLGEETPATAPKPDSKPRNTWGQQAAATDTSRSTETRSSYDDERTAMANGTAWIRAAIRAIDKGELPKGNPPERCILDYALGSAGRGTTSVRLVDYSGESIDADMKGPARDGILRHFRTCDGLIVVAEAVPDDAPDRAVVEARVQKVVDFFVSLHGRDEQRLATAVAVVLTKWDTVSPVDFDDPASENADIERYIAARPIYQNLVTHVSNIVVQQHDTASMAGRHAGVRRGNTVIFASSSFGHSVEEPDGSRVPLLSARRPFCLIDPLLWLADRADAIAVADLAKASQGFGAWLPWNALPTLRRAQRAVARTPRKSETRRQVVTFRNAAVMRLVAAGLLLLMVGDFVRFTALRLGVSSRRSAIASGRATVEELDSARQYGLDVVASPWNGLPAALVPAFRPDGSGLVTLATTTLENTLGTAAGAAKAGESVATKQDAFKAYLKYLPAGEHAGEYAALLKSVEDEQRLQRDHTALAELEAGVSTLDEAGCDSRLTQLAELLAQASQWTPSMDETAAGIRVQLRQRQKQVIDEKLGQALKERIDKALKSDNYTAAVDYLITHADKNDDWERQASGLATNILEACRARVRTLAERPNFPEAMNVGESARQALRKAGDIPSRFTAPRDAFRTALPALNDMLAATVERPYDQSLYNAISTRRSDEACREYLAKAPLKAMERSVLQFRNFLGEQNGARDLTVTAHITWGELEWDGTPGYSIRQLVKVNRDVKVDESFRTGNRTGQQEAIGRPFVVNARSADEFLDIDIVFTEDDWPGADDDVGTWRGSLTPLQMQAEKRIDVNGKALVSPHTIWFTVEKNAYPNEPSLPPWSARP